MTNNKHSLVNGATCSHNKTTSEILQNAYQGHLEIIEFLMSVEGAQFVPLCDVLIQRIRRFILPVIEDGMEASWILDEMKKGVLQTAILASLNTYIERALKLPSYPGGGSYEK